MNINIHSILGALVSDYVIKKTEKKEIVKIDNIDRSENIFDNSYETVLRYILFNVSSEDDYDDVVKDINEKLETMELNELLNKMKITLSIEQNIVNNEVLLFLSGYFDINIYVFHTVSRIMRIYYLEEQLCTNKNSILLFYTQEDDTNGSYYQTTLNKTLFTYDEEFIQNNLSTIYTIPVGMLAKKRLLTSTNKENVEFFTDKVDDLNFINEDDILFSSNELDSTPDLVEHEVYDYRTFDVKAFNKRYNKKKMLMELYVLNINK